MDLFAELLRTEPGKLALIAIVLLAAVPIIKTVKGRGRRSPLMSLAGISGADEEDLTESVLKKIDERVMHKWNNAVAPTFTRESMRTDKLERDVGRLDTAREDARIDSARVQMRLASLEVGQADMNKKLDRLLERE